ncbi:MAG: restriction endonuclease subunit S [Planctomycetales bacterium]
MKWQEKQLDQLGTVLRGRSRHRPRDAEHLYGGPYPFVQTGDVKHADLYLKEYTQTYSQAGLEQSKLWPAGTLCITIAANIADTAILGIEACFPDSVIGFVADESESDVRFIKYKFDTIKRRYQQVSHGAAQDNLSQEKLLSFSLSVPPVEMQRRIADILSAYDDLIENNRRRMALLEEAARQLYQEWFVRLRFPGHEHTRITDGVPAGWKRITIGELVDLGEIDLQTGPFGTQLKASDYADDGSPVINVRNIGFGEVRAEKLEFVPEEMVQRLHQHVLKAGDIVFGRKGAVDRHVLVRPTQDGWIQGSDCIRMRSHSDRVSTLLLSLAFRETAHKEWMLTQCSNKATMASLNQDVLSRIVTVLPIPTIHREFVDLA